MSLGTGVKVVATGIDPNTAQDYIIQDMRQTLANNLEWIRGRVIEILRRYAPVRTGKYLDTLLQTLTVTMIGDSVIINTEPPAGYPNIIKNPKHFSDVGYGPKYNPLNTIEKRSVKEETPKGAYYNLNDPEAVGNLQVLLQNYVLPELELLIDQIPWEYEVTIEPPEAKEEKAIQQEIPINITQSETITSRVTNWRREVSASANYRDHNNWGQVSATLGFERPTTARRVGSITSRNVPVIGYNLSNAKTPNNTFFGPKAKITRKHLTMDDFFDL